VRPPSDMPRSMNELWPALRKLRATCLEWPEFFGPRDEEYDLWVETTPGTDAWDYVVVT
jgi:hypothetical protein